ncbi:MAG: hypothetical protein DRQ40_06245 [Gammaproteobacteria bacterium]|nr:MAG: hypothetical protein DRQ40_06245 [Gammaproteobacteria bacterium]
MIELVSLSGSFNKTSSDCSYHYVSGDQGIIVMRISDNKEVAYATISGINDIISGDSQVFLGTTSGVLYFNKKENWQQQNFQDDVSFHSRFPDLISEEVLSLATDSDHFLLVGTTSGVTLVSGGNYFSSDEFDNVKAVGISEDRRLYYGGDFGLAAKRTTVTGSWTSDYLLDDTTIPPMFPVSAITLTEDNNKRVIAAATDTGVLIIKEEEIVGNSSIIQLLT